MDAPKCRLCGQKHYGVEHVWPGSPLEEAGARKEPNGLRAAGNDDTASTKGKKQGWNREAYNAYQREYMRKVRAK